MLFRFGIDEATAHDRFGPPHYGPAGPRGLPAWGFELEDGTVFELHHRKADDTCYVNGDLRDIGYLVRILDVVEAVERLDEDEHHYLLALEEHYPAAQRHRVLDADGNQVLETPSPRDAAHFAARIDGRVEIEPLEEARARRASVLERRALGSKRPPAPVRAVSTDGTWEVWRVTDDGGRSLVGVFDDRDRAQATIDADPDATFELRPRAS